MPKQPEQILEDNLVMQVQTLGYSCVSVNDERDLLANLVEPNKPKSLIFYLQLIKKLNVSQSDN